MTMTTTTGATRRPASAAATVARELPGPQAGTRAGVGRKAEDARRRQPGAGDIP